MAITAAISGCSDVCSNDVVRRVPSSDGKLEAVIFVRNCGGTADYSTQVSLLSLDEKLGRTGNLFVSDSDHQKAVRYIRDSAWVDVRWLNNKHLLISYADKSRVFKSVLRMDDVDISYARVGR
jgi:hypothetical protein